MNGKLYLCSTPIGNLEDITYRVVRTLSEVDVIAAEDTRHSLKLLNHFDIKKPMVSYYEHNKIQRGNEIIAMLKEGKNVALISDAGMPAISDPGEELVMQCIEENIDVVPLPGPNAALTALIASGMPTGRFAFHGFLTTNKTARKQHLTEIAEMEETVILYEAPHKLKSTLKDMLEILGNRRITLCRELTKTFEEFVRTDVESAIALYEEKPPKGEYVIIIEGKQKQAGDDFKEFSVEELYEMYIGQGMNDKDALKAVAKDKGISKRDVYAKVKV